MSKLIARVAYFPSLVWDVVVCQVLRGLNRWDFVEEDLLLGVCPTRSDVKKLHELGVRAVVNTCEEMAGPTGEYARLGIEQLRIPTVDFTEPSLADIKSAIEFINQKRGSACSVYVHCKSGRGRSSTVILCWLMQFYNLSPEEAQHRLQGKRKQVLKQLFHRKSVQQFWLETQCKRC